MRKSPQKKIMFELVTAPGRHVSVAGTFNNWDPAKNPMVEDPGPGHYKAVIAVRPGKYEYKFVVDGEWSVDPNCPTWVANNHGSLNSLLRVVD